MATNQMEKELNLSSGYQKKKKKAVLGIQFHWLPDTDFLAKTQKGKSFTSGFAYCEGLTKLSLSQSIKPGPGNNF